GLGDTGWSEPDFTEAVEAALARPERLASRLFGLRAEGLLDGLAPERARSKLSGFLIGAELASARPHWLGRDVVLIGTPAIAEPYRLGLALSGLTARTADATEMTLAGLAAARAPAHDASALSDPAGRAPRPGGRDRHCRRGCRHRLDRSAAALTRPARQHGRHASSPGRSGAHRRRHGADGRGRRRSRSHRRHL